ncbi:sulfur oxidation c-type cytochrome SoxX [Endothiovibrio diazotrophicus]
MRRAAKGLMTMTALGTLLSLSLMTGPARAADEGMSSVDQGRAIAFDRKKGNCLACHHIEGGASPGNIGPALLHIAARFPDRARLKAQLWDATQFNPSSPMPPFGKHKVLSEGQIEKVVDFLMTL